MQVRRLLISKSSKNKRNKTQDQLPKILKDKKVNKTFMKTQT
jgi:hypothetical protein